VASAAFNGGYTMTQPGDVVPADVHGTTVGDIIVKKIIIEKTTNGFVVLKDGSGVNIHVTETITGGQRKEMDFKNWRTNGVEYDAVSAGSAIVRVFVGKGGRYGQ
jgi:hypothetical protein